MFLICQNVGLKIRVEGLHQELRHEVKENVRADRVITALMKITGSTFQKYCHFCVRYGVEFLFSFTNPFVVLFIVAVCVLNSLFSQLLHE